MSDGTENKALREENAKLRAEVDMLKAEKMLIPQKPSYQQEDVYSQ